MDAVKLLGALLGNNATGGNLLGSILGGGGQQAAPQGGGAAGLLKGILGGGGAPQAGGGGGAAGLLGSLLGGGGAAGGGSNSMLGGLLKGAIAKQMGGGGGGAGGAMGMLGGLLGGGAPEPEPEPPQRQAANDQATILIRAMCNAAKADGQVDQQEQQNIIGKLGELDQGEIDFLKQELSSPLDASGFARSVPQELGPQVYALSVMTVKVDTREEVQYLTQLAQGLGLNQQTLDAIHQQAGLA